MQPANTSFVAEDERQLVRDALIGIAVGMIAFSLVTFFVVLIGWPDQSVGFAAVIALFCGPWAGLFFGSAGGAAYSQWRAGKEAGTAGGHPDPFSGDPATSAVRGATENAESSAPEGAEGAEGGGDERDAERQRTGNGSPVRA